MELEEEIKRQLINWKKEVGKIDRSLLPLVDEFIKSNEGGKRIRGKLVVLGYKLGDSSLIVQNDNDDIVKVAAAYEIFHTAILAHDDIIDKDIERRGQASLYQALGGDHKGISLAICLADAGFFLAEKIICERNFPPDVKLEALNYFAKVKLDTAIGQMLDIEKGDSLKVAKYKTAKYTVSGPLVLGAILAGNKIDKLDQFGEDLGIAFQIKDDILDGETKDTKSLNVYKNQALKIIPGITKDPEMSKLLEQLVESLINRKK